MSLRFVSILLVVGLAVFGVVAAALGQWLNVVLCAVLIALFFATERRAKYAYRAGWFAGRAEMIDNLMRHTDGGLIRFREFFEDEVRHTQFKAADKGWPPS